MDKLGLGLLKPFYTKKPAHAKFICDKGGVIMRENQDLILEAQKELLSAIVRLSKSIEKNSTSSKEIEALSSLVESTSKLITTL